MVLRIKMQKKIWFAVIGCVLFFDLPFLTWAADTALPSIPGNTPYAVVLTWSAAPATTQTISWKADARNTTGWVSYGMAGTSPETTALTQTQVALVEKFQPFPGDTVPDTNIFFATLTGLKPGTRYVYEVTAGGFHSNRHGFATADGNIAGFKFLVFGDSQSGSAGNLDYTQWGRTLHQAYQQNPDAKFFVPTGDLVEIGQSFIHWQNWFSVARGVIDTIPIMPVQGNHETYCPNFIGRDPKPVYFISQFPVFDNGPAELKKRVYAFDYGPVHFTVLDSQGEEEARYGDILKIQQTWLEKDLATTNQPWKIVFFHKSPYGNRAFRDDGDVKNAFCPILEQYHVNVVFSGHDHVLSRTYPMRGDRRQAVGEKGTVYYIDGRSGAKFYTKVSERKWNAFFYNPQDQPCYLAVEAAASGLTITARKQDGTLLDAYFIEK
jgi:hypothetical protein